MKKTSIDEVKTALYEANGLIRVAAAMLAISPQALRARIKRNAELQNVLSEAREQIVDKAEESLWDCIKNRDPWAVALVLKTLGKSRGYVERQEVAGKDGGAIVVDWDGIDSNQD